METCRGFRHAVVVVVIIFGLKRLEHVYPTASVASEEIQALRYHIRRDVGSIQIQLSPHSSPPLPTRKLPPTPPLDDV